MDLSSLLSDDQLAVMGCFLALMVCGGIAAVSFQFGPTNRPQNIDSIRFRPSAGDSSRDESTQKAA